MTADTLATLQHAFKAFDPPLPLGVAFSGGADSTALLALCAKRWPGQVVALHVNHGLQAAAYSFEQQCLATCAQLGVPLRVARVDVAASPGDSPEDAARRARYRALVALASPTTLASESAGGDAVGLVRAIALAQHADDQVETMLLALSRGAGLAGLSAMPTRWERSGLHWHRPLLQVAGETLRAWVQAQSLGFVDDPSNADTRFTRNRIRHDVLPALLQVFPQFRQTLARSASHCAQAQELLDALAQQDLSPCLRSDGLPRIRDLQALVPTRQANVLRYWLRSRYQVIPSAAQLLALQKQIDACTTRAHRIDLKVGPGYVERVDEVLSWYNRRVLLSTN